ncbi:MAG: hypothetical protein BA870_03385 [Desulfuromonadales bacterium C00003094]|nr:MAG: hypothetical protein BA870_03385 [Desulfuromonadales bacterium C00003094]
MTCVAASRETRLTPTSWPGRDLTQMGFTTGISTKDVVFGGEEKLRQAIDYIVVSYAPEAVFVYSTCVTAMIGDDIDAACRQTEEAHGIPMVPVHAPGFVGSKNLGSRLAGKAVLNHLVGTMEPETITPFDINLIGEYNVTGDMWQYTPLLEELGIRVLSTLSGDGRISYIRTAHRAKLNVLVCAKSLISLTRKMEQRHGMPSISVSFYGKQDTSASILAIAEALVKKNSEIRHRSFPHLQGLKATDQLVAALLDASGLDEPLPALFAGVNVCRAPCSTVIFPSVKRAFY